MMSVLEIPKLELHQGQGCVSLNSCVYLLSVLPLYRTQISRSLPYQLLYTGGSASEMSLILSRVAGHTLLVS